MKLDKLMAGVWQTQKHLTSAKMGAAGWDLGEFDGSMAAAPSVYLYVHDQPTGWAWMRSVPRELFTQVSNNAFRNKQSWPTIRGGLGHMISTLADGVAIDPINDLGANHQLAALLCSYAGTTQVWEISDRLRAGGHFIVSNYRRAGRNDSMLRPFAQPDKGTGVLPADAFFKMVRLVMEMDKERHQEWFQ